MSSYHKAIAIATLLTLTLIIVGCSSRDSAVLEAANEFWTGIATGDAERTAAVLAPGAPDSAEELISALQFTEGPHIDKHVAWHGGAAAVVMVSYSDSSGYTHTTLTAVVRDAESDRFLVACVGNHTTYHPDTGEFTCENR